MIDGVIIYSNISNFLFHKKQIFTKIRNNQILLLASWCNFNFFLNIIFNIINIENYGYPNKMHTKKK